MARARPLMDGTPAPSDPRSHLNRASRANRANGAERVTTQNTDQDTQADIEIENAARDRHQLRTLAVAVTTVSVVLFAVVVAIIYAIPLNRIWFLNFPLGFYLLAQGLLLFVVFVTFWYVRVQERIDLTRSMNEEIT